MFNKITDIAARVYDFGSDWAKRQTRRFKLPQISARLARYFSKPIGLVSIESFVAVSLAVYYFFLLLPMAETGRHYGHDTQTLAYFTEHSQHPFASDDFSKDKPEVKTRLPGQIITGWLTDLMLKYWASNPNHLWSMGVWYYHPFECVFAAYHAAWLLLLFGLLIRYRTDALLIILGVFSGLMLNLSWPSWQYFFPWDLPSMCFFTWAILTYDNSKKILPLMTIVWLGALFKETTLCCSLLILLGEHWPWKKRLVSFAVTLVAYSLTKKLLMLAYAVPVDFLSTNNFFSGLHLLHNFEVTFSHPGLNHIVFVNAGAYLLMLLLPWRTYRQMLLKLIAMIFMTGIWLFGEVIEFRVWYEILPLGWILISEALTQSRQEIEGMSGNTAISSSSYVLNDRTKRVLKGLSWLGACGLLVLLAGTAVIAGLVSSEKNAVIIASDANTNYFNLNTNPVSADAKAVNTAVTPATNTNPKDVSNIKQTPRPIPNFDRLEVLNNLAWALATSPNATNRDGALAVKLAERACEKTRYQVPAAVNTLAAAYAEAGRFDDAVATAQKACDLATASGDTVLLKENQDVLALYRKGQPFREEPPKP